MNSILKFICFLILTTFGVSEGMKILCVFPTPTHGSNNVYKTLTSELLHRGYNLVILTTEPGMYEGGEGVQVVDLGDISHKIWGKKYLTKNIKRTMNINYFTYYDIMLEITNEQLKNENVAKLINSPKEEFDLLLVESYIPTWYAFAEHFNIPVVSICPQNPGIQDLERFGVPTHPALYPDNAMFVRHDMENLTFFQKISLFFEYLSTMRTFNNIYLPRYEKIAKHYFGNSISLRKIMKNVNVLIVNVHPLMFGIRPTVPGVVFAGGMHVGAHKDLPQWMSNFMEDAEHGVVLFSLGSSLMSQYLPEDKIKVFVEAFAELPYKFVWKWETKDLPGHPKNVLINDWTHQEDILANLKTMAFITAGGRQSIDEAINYQVPMVGIPIFGDHHSNIAKMTQLGLGVQLDYHSLNKEDLKKAIVDVVTNETYKHRLADVFSILEDEPVPSLQKVIWWIEYTIRHSGAENLKHKHDHLSGFQYYFLDIICFLIFVGVILIILVGVCIMKLKKKIIKRKTSFGAYSDPKKMT